MNDDLGSGGHKDGRSPGAGTLYGDDSGFGRASRRAKYSRNQRLAMKYFFVAVTLGVFLFIAIIVSSFLSYKLASSRGQLVEYQNLSRQQQSISRDLEFKVAALEKEVGELRDEAGALVQNRIPLLRLLDFDVIFPLDIQYLKNISFTRIGTKAEKKYVYRAVLENAQRKGITPEVTILLFDGLGIQVGMTKLTKESSASDTHYLDLRPGESRAYSSQIYLTRNAEPKYFLIEVR